MSIYQHHASAVLAPRKKSEESTGYKSGWVSESLHVEKRPRLTILQPVHYTDWNVTVHRTREFIRAQHSLSSFEVLKWKMIFSCSNTLNA